MSTAIKKRVIICVDNTSHDTQFDGITTLTRSTTGSRKRIEALGQALGCPIRDTEWFLDKKLADSHDAVT